MKQVLECLDCRTHYLRDPNRGIQALFCPSCSVLKDAEKEAFALASKLDGERRMREKRVRDHLFDRHAQGKHRGMNLPGCAACRIRDSKAMTEPEPDNGAIPRALK